MAFRFSTLENLQRRLDVALEADRPQELLFSVEEIGMLARALDLFENELTGTEEIDPEG